MFDQGWHLVYGPVQVPVDVTPDTQVTEPYMLVFRMSGNSGDPGPEITVWTFGNYSDPNGQRADGSWPPIVVTAMISYAIRDDSPDRDVTDEDYEYRQGIAVYPTAVMANVGASTLARDYAQSQDSLLNWTGESAMHRQGGFLPAKTE